MGYVTVSAKIRKELREKLRELGIKPSEVIKRALEEEVEKKTREKLLEKVEKAGEIIERAGAESWIRVIRESREER